MSRHYADNVKMLPEHMQEGVLMWINHGIMTGSFMTAIMENDFLNAVGQADETNKRALHTWATFLYCYAPRGSFGSKENVAAWREHNGLDNLHRRQQR